MAAARCSSGIAAIGRPRRARRRRRRLADGELKFTLEGERLHGSWVLVRMSTTGAAASGTNWLLIKHRDEAAAATATRSSPRIARSPRGARWPRSPPAGAAGRSPSCRRSTADPARSGTAIRAHAARKRARAPRRRARPTRPDARGRDCRRFHRAAAVPSRSSGRRRARAGCTRSSSTAIASSCASPAASATLRTRKGLDWTDQVSPPIAEGGGGSARWHHRRRDRRARSQRRARFRRAAGRAVRGRDRRPGLLRFRSAVRRRRGSARAAAVRAQGAAATRCSARATATALIRYRRAFRDRRRRRAALGLPHVAGRHRLEAARRALSRPGRGDAGPRRNAAPGMRS